MPVMPFAEYLPDQAPLTGRSDVLNAFPGLKGYIPCPSMAPFSGPAAQSVDLQADEWPTGMFTAIDNALNHYWFLGTTKRLYRFDAATNALVDVTRVAGLYTGVEDYQWRFVQWGDWVLCVNNRDVIQQFQLGSSTNFIDMPDAATKNLTAADITVVRDHVVLGNTTDSDSGDGRRIYRVRWSAINNPFDWTQSPTTLADWQDRPELGDVKRVMGGDYLTILMDKGISIGTYEGAPLVFRFDNLIFEGGCFIPGSAIRVDNVVYYIGSGGLKRFNGTRTENFGTEKVDRSLIGWLNANTRQRITAIRYPNQPIIMWGIQTNGSSNGEPDKILAYNYSSDRFSLIDQSHRLLGIGTTPAYNSDNVDGLYANSDQAMVSVDSRQFVGGSEFAAAVVGLKVQTLTGAPRAARLETPETQFTPGQRSVVRRFRPLVDGDVDITAQVGERMAQDENQPVWSDTLIPENNGSVKSRSKARYHRFSVDLAAGGAWRNALGVDVSRIETAGRR